MTTSGLGPLADGATVVIIGGGPAGVACGLACQRTALAKGLRIEVTIIEGKQFDEERQYNQCLGVLSPPLPDLLEQDLGIPFPWQLSRGEIQEYVLHSEHEQLTLCGEHFPSVALRRVQFDAYMLQAARERGVDVMPARAVDLEFHEQGVVVYTDSAPLEGEVVVGAFGLDDGSATAFERHTRYRRPACIDTLATKYHPGEEAMSRFGPRIHAFLPAHPHIEFAAVTPKGNHLSIAVAGRRVNADLMRHFLALPGVRPHLPGLERAGERDANDLRFFKGRFPCSLAGGYYGDRHVMVGDAAGLVRAFKGKGVTTAVQTGLRAADTIMHVGISARAFHESYRRANQAIRSDYPYGQLMRLLTIGLARTDLLDLILRAAGREPRVRAALFDAVSGRTSYREVLANSLSVAGLWAILRQAGAGRLLTSHR
jgi:flavin-dependent dehydrogenase